ncbi:unnamed protein product [Ascophyllum nodosum]
MCFLPYAFHVIVSSVSLPGDHVLSWLLSFLFPSVCPPLLITYYDILLIVHYTSVCFLFFFSDHVRPRFALV